MDRELIRDLRPVVVDSFSYRDSRRGLRGRRRTAVADQRYPLGSVYDVIDGVGRAATARNSLADLCGAFGNQAQKRRKAPNNARRNRPSCPVQERAPAVGADIGGEQNQRQELAHAAHSERNRHGEPEILAVSCTGARPNEDGTDRAEKERDESACGGRPPRRAKQCTDRPPKPTRGFFEVVPGALGVKRFRNSDIARLEEPRKEEIVACRLVEYRADVSFDWSARRQLFRPCRDRRITRRRRTRIFVVDKQDRFAWPSNLA